MNVFSPKDAAEQTVKSTHIPQTVIDVVNGLLAANYRIGTITLAQDDIIAALLITHPGMDREDVFKHRWLDFEPLYAANGWDVRYDRPAYNESGTAKFLFTPRKG
jgi:hypothetical protein